MSVKILVVDDHEGMSLTLQDILEEEGYAVDVAHDGSEALSAAKRTSYEAALLDLRLPDMDGVELFSQLKPLCPGLKVVMMSAYIDRGLEDSALKKGAVTFLRKPLDMDQILAIFRSISEG